MDNMDDSYGTSPFTSINNRQLPPLGAAPYAHTGQVLPFPAGPPHFSPAHSFHPISGLADLHYQMGNPRAQASPMMPMRYPVGPPPAEPWTWQRHGALRPPPPMPANPIDFSTTQFRTFDIRSVDNPILSIAPSHHGIHPDRAVATAHSSDARRLQQRYNSSMRTTPRPASDASGHLAPTIQTPYPTYSSTPPHRRPPGGPRTHTMVYRSSGYSSTAHARLVSPTADRPERRRGVQSRVRRVTYAQDPSTTSSNQLDSSSQTTGSSPRVEESEPTAARAHHGYLEPVGFSHAQHIQRYLARKAMCIKSIMHDFEKVDIQELPTAERACIICYNDFGVKSPENTREYPVRLPDCKHVFGHHCLRKWLAESPTCPYCRDKLYKGSRRRYSGASDFMNMMRMRDQLAVGGFPEESMTQTFIANTEYRMADTHEPSTLSYFMSPHSDGSSDPNRRVDSILVPPESPTAGRGVARAASVSSDDCDDLVSDSETSGEEPDGNEPDSQYDSPGRYYTDSSISQGLDVGFGLINESQRPLRTLQSALVEANIPRPQQVDPRASTTGGVVTLQESPDIDTGMRYRTRSAARAQRR